MTDKTPEQIADELKASIAEKHDAVLKTADAALKEAEKSGAMSLETKDAVDKALTGINVLREQLADIEQKMARKPGENGEVKSFGAQVVAADRYKSYMTEGARGNVRFELKAITAAQSGSAWSERDPEIVGLQMRQLRIRDLLSVVSTSSASIDYAKQTTRTNNAAVVAEGATKPSSAYVWTQVNAPVRTIAHLVKITRQALEDSAQLQGEVDMEMRYGLGIAEEAELLYGDGTGQHLTGLMTGATAYAAPGSITVTDKTKIDVLRIALLQAELALYPTDGIVLSPGDWADIELTKDSQGRYIWSTPAGLLGPRLWAKPVVPTTAMTADDFLVGGFKLQTLYDRMAPEVMISSENADDFEKNLYTMRCEERLALAVKRGGALIKGTFAAALA